MPETVLLTGGAGFIGSHLAERLHARGDSVVVLDDFNDYYDPVIKRANSAPLLGQERYRLVEGDIRDGALCERLFAEGGFDVVVHLAARAGVRPSLQDPLLYESANGLGTVTLLEAARRHGVKRFVFGSSSSVYGANAKLPFAEDDPVNGPVSPYAATKRANELMCYTYSHLYGMKTTCLRFFTVYGPRQRPEMAIHMFTRLIDRGEPVPFFGDGSSRRDYTYIDDILQGVIAAIDRPMDYEIINLGESNTVTLAELVALIEKALGKKANLDRRPVQPGDVPATYANIDKARRLLGYDPHTLPQRGIERFVAWYREMNA